MRLTLQDALERGLITAELRSAGEGVTAKIRLKLTNRSSDHLTIDIPRGTKFVPIRPSMMNRSIPSDTLLNGGSSDG